MQAMQHDAGKRVHHGGGGRDGQDVARDFDGALACLAIHFFHALAMRHRTDVPDVAEDFARVAFEQRGQLFVIAPGARHGVFVNGALGRAKSGNLGREISGGMRKADVALALLLGVVKRVRVQERPDKLPADVFQAEFKVRVLVDGVMPAVKRGRADLQALLVGDFLGADQARRVAGARRGHGRVEGMSERVTQRDARHGCLELHAIRLRRCHRLSGHVWRGILHYCGGLQVEPAPDCGT